MSPVFGHGRLRLYLLKLLDEHPRHGYEVIRLLQDRFLGVYSPSPGTIYPRLARLEEEGLVTHEVVDGKKVFKLTDAGRGELTGRFDELSDLERELADSVRDIAREVKEDVRQTVRSLRHGITQMTREMGREMSRPNQWERQKQEWRRLWEDSWAEASSLGSQQARAHAESAKELGRILADFIGELRRAAADANLSEQTLTTIRSTLDDATKRIKDSFHEDPTKPR
ncbi:helix-turn-helix transcriptional regulator [Rhizohabitans arisaemae]|uniref:helix-turn-helix transcriptional regulator n=1 Tax=Rhizohabitans arisaemae TaxID=2720610 RepID=UPI0024B0D06D|nr:helix-turn-helix transcriptional regulator [Rhizohabitans arisaemae]